MDINPIILSSVVSIFALLVPVITSIVDRKTQLQLKNLDLFYKEKSDIYQRFCTSTKYLTYWIYNEYDDRGLPNDKYYEIHRLAYLVSNDKVRSLLDLLTKEINLYHDDITLDINILEFNNLIDKIIKSMNEDLQNYRP